MLDHLVEDLLLFKLPVGDVGGSQPSWSHTNNHLLASFLIIWIRPHSLFSPFIQGCDGIVQDNLAPWIWDLVQVVLDFTLGGGGHPNNSKSWPQCYPYPFGIQGQSYNWPTGLPISVWQHPDLPRRRCR